jgi:hypothetical protein
LLRIEIVRRGRKGHVAAGGAPLPVYFIVKALTKQIS